ncbi:MAG: MFS transporter [Chloroflexota bacterium]|nr:MFS transporter [Deltaproteobacteria bacterium]MDE2969229.1 MFS transporter [Chloroflexota bacterium]
MLDLLLRRFPLLTALVHRDFRLYWSGHAVAVAGQQMAIVTQMWLIFDLTGSALQLGLLGLARAVPGIIMNLVGGVLADKFDQRKLLIGASTVTALLFATLGILTFSGRVEVWHVLAVVFGTGACEAFMQPSRQALFPNLIDRQHMMSAVGLNSAVHPGTRIFAPLVAGLLIDRVGMGLEGAATALFVISGLTLVFTFALLWVRVPPIRRAAAGGGFQTMVEGLGYVANSRIFLLIILTSFSNAFFGGGHMILLPVFADKLLGEASGTSLAVLSSAGGVGGLTGAVIGGSLGRFRRHGWLIVGGSLSFGGSLVLFALAPWFWLLVAMEWIASASNQLFNVTSQATLHALVPDEFRGRVMGLRSMMHSVAQPLGGLQMGGVASVIGATAAVVISAGCLLTVTTLGIARDGRVRNLSGAFGRSSQPPAPVAVAEAGS